MPEPTKNSNYCQCGQAMTKHATFRTGRYKSNHFDGPSRHSLYGTMAAMHENEAPPAVPATIDDLVCAFDSAYPTLDGQLGPKVRMRKQKTKGNPRTREVPNFNGWLNVHTLVQAGNETLERNGIKMEKIEIAETAAAGAAVSLHSSHAGPCVQQCSCTVHVTEADVLAAAEEIKKRQQQGTRSTASIVLDAKILTDDRSRSIAAGSKYVRLQPSTISSPEELRSAQASAASAGSTVPVYAPDTGRAAPASAFDPIPKSMPNGLPKGDGTRAEKIVHMFEEEFCTRT